jgi:hypothetical protein
MAQEADNGATKMKNDKRMPAVMLIAACAMLAFSGCGDLEKYEKPAQEKSEAKPQAEPEVKSVDIRGTPEDQKRGREFKLRLDRLRAELMENNDTLAAIAALDVLLVDVNTQRKALPEGAEFGTFYLLMMADILNQTVQLRRRIGDEEGARAAQNELIRIRNQLPM